MTTPSPIDIAELRRLDAALDAAMEASDWTAIDIARKALDTLIDQNLKGLLDAAEKGLAANEEGFDQTGLPTAADVRGILAAERTATGGDEPTEKNPHDYSDWAPDEWPGTQIVDDQLALLKKDLAAPAVPAPDKPKGERTYGEGKEALSLAEIDHELPSWLDADPGYYADGFYAAIIRDLVQHVRELSTALPLKGEEQE